MFSITYTSDNGSVALGGGSHPLLRVRSITGLCTPGREYASATTAQGQRETGRRDLPRTITIGGDLLGNGDDLENLERVVYADGYLELCFGDKQRRIACKFNGMTDPERIISGELSSFAVQFLCDSPYFEDAEATFVDIATYKNEVVDTFTLPCVFTTTQNERTLTVKGVKSVYPIIHIGCTEAGDNGVAYGFVVTNLTTGQSIELEHDIVALEEVTVDCKERTVTSSIKGNILNSLADSSSLEDMYLLPGDNVIAAYSLSNGGNIYVQAEFRSEYIAMEY